MVFGVILSVLKLHGEPGGCLRVSQFSDKEELWAEDDPFGRSCPEVLISSPGRVGKPLSPPLRRLRSPELHDDARSELTPLPPSVTHGNFSLGLLSQSCSSRMPEPSLSLA